MSIELKNVCYTYAENTPFEATAVRDISLSIQDGEFVGIMGKTGCGKSTLIQLLAGLIAPSCGKVLLDGEDINDKSYERDRLRKRVGVVFQYPEYQLFETTVARDVSFGLRHFDMSDEQKLAAVKSALNAVGFNYDEVCDKSPLGLSGGEKRRIAIAGVLAVKPKILILDEPIAGLDPLGRREFLEMICRLNKEGVSVIMISHNADALSEYADRIIILKEGSLVRDDKAQNVFKDINGLRKDGICAGQVRETVEILRGKGIELPEDTIRYEQFIEKLAQRFGGER